MRVKQLLVVCCAALAAGACMFSGDPEKLHFWTAETVTLDKRDVVLNLWTGTPGYDGSYYDNRTAVITAHFSPEKAVFRRVLWVSSDPGVATVSAVEGAEDGTVQAVVTAVSEGAEAVTITLSVEDAYGSLTERAVCRVEVWDDEPVLANTVDVSPRDSLVLYLGGAYQMETLRPVFNPSVVIYDDVSWRSVVVNENGGIILDDENREIDGSHIATVEKSRVVQETENGRKTIVNSAVVRATGAGTTGIIVTTTGEAVLSWQAPSNQGASSVTGYEVSVSMPDDDEAAWVSVDESTFSHTFYGILSDVDYTYRVRAVNLIGYGASAVFPPGGISAPAEGLGAPAAPAGFAAVSGGFSSQVCVVTVTPQTAQFANIQAFLDSGYYRSYEPGFDFGTSPDGPASGWGAPPGEEEDQPPDSDSNRATWNVGANPNEPDLVIDYSTVDYDLYGRAGSKNLAPKFTPGDNVPASAIEAGPYRSHSQFNNASLAHYAFTGFRQALPWGIKADDNGTTRAGQTWSPGFEVYAANTNTVQYSGIGVDLEEDTLIDMVVLYAGGGIAKPGALNYRKDINTQCPSITLEYATVAGYNAFDMLYKANLQGESTANWNNPYSQNNWPAPGYADSPWRAGGKIVPNGESWVYVFHFEEPVSARYLRVSFEQGAVSPPATGYLGRVFVNSFEVYNTRNEY